MARAPSPASSSVTPEYRPRVLYLLRSSMRKKERKPIHQPYLRALKLCDLGPGTCPLWVSMLMCRVRLTEEIFESVPKGALCLHKL